MDKKNKSFSPYFTESDAEQVRAAFLAAGHLEGYASITELIEAATMREVRRLRRRHNAGRKWPGVPAGALRPGRRTREELRQHYEKSA
ncbi:hypothetical protein ASG92_21690 [Arthrobacter sp. Soil736]|uniref:ParB family protein n=1 Tax=Arthrobacter sp. Soil736 TaxID=1736395 RepID=UPI000701CDE1|nr:hypothetical protein [Arthrobacter sp. Soil736]KRE60561.1 hypothetical protein ASG92_21690 [Arthrobacter sp. Soil736]